MTDDQKKDVLRLCKFVIHCQKNGKVAIPGHRPRSYIFTDCSMACQDECLAQVARKLMDDLSV